MFTVFRHVVILNWRHWLVTGKAFQRKDFRSSFMEWRERISEKEIPQGTDLDVLMFAALCNIHF